MTSHTLTPGNPAQNPATHEPQGANDSSLSPEAKYRVKLLSACYRAVNESFAMLTVFKNPSAKAAAAMVEDTEILLDAAKRLQAAIPEKHEPQPFKINPPKRVSVAEIIKQRNKEIGLEPLPLESDLLLQRIAQGGHSGQFLADAFISAYRTHKPFPHSLGELLKLDPEGIRLFHEILHIRLISGWNDNSLYQIEQQIEAILKAGEL